MSPHIFDFGNTWTLHGLGGRRLRCELLPMGGADTSTRDESVRELRMLELRRADAIDRRTLQAIASRLSRPMTGALRPETLALLLEHEARAGRIVVRRVEMRRVIVPLEEEPALGPVEDSPEALPDMFVLAAEVKLLGDTPLILHPVRIVDPDTLEIVVDGIFTDEDGIVRTEVPKNKTYRIEILDRDLGWDAPMAHEPPHATLRCEFVDALGEPIADLDVTAKHDGHEFAFTTDDRGRIDVAALLGHYELTVGDETFDAHALLSHDEDSAYRFVVIGREEGGADDEHPDDRLPRYEIDADDERALELSP